MKAPEIIVRDTLEKAVSALAMIPKTNSITRVGRQAYTVMMLVAREQSKLTGEQSVFSSPLKTVVRGFQGADGSMAELKRHLRSMVTHLVEWQSPSPAETNDWEACALLAHVKLYSKGGETWIDWSYAANLRQEMLSPQRFAQLRRSTIAQFRSHAGLALYEICARYKDNPSGLTSKQHWHWWLPVLTGKPVPAEIRTQFRFFNRDTIKPAIEEVNEVSELTITAREIKVGRTIEMLQFEVKRKEEPAAVAVPVAVDISILVRASALGIDGDLAEDLLIRFGTTSLDGALGRLAERLRQPGSPIISRPAYLKAILSGKTTDKPRQALDLQASAGDQPGQPAFGARLLSEVHIQNERLKEQEGEQFKVIRAEIEALSPENLSALLDSLKLHLKIKGTTPSMFRRLEEGKWQSALVMGELFRFYWTQTRGVDWKTADAPLPTVHRVEQAGLFP